MRIFPDSPRSKWATGVWNSSQDVRDEIFNDEALAVEAVAASVEVGPCLSHNLQMDDPSAWNTDCVLPVTVTPSLVAHEAFIMLPVAPLPTVRIT